MVAAVMVPAASAMPVIRLPNPSRRILVTMYPAVPMLTVPAVPVIVIPAMKVMPIPAARRL